MRSRQRLSTAAIAIVLSASAVVAAPRPTFGASPTPKPTHSNQHTIQHQVKWTTAQSRGARSAMSSIQTGTPVGGSWTSIGPQPETEGQWGNVAGRVTSLVSDPTNGAVIYAGTAGGGVWKSTNSGGTWTPLTDSQASLAIGALAIDPTGQVMYAGTGEDNYCIDCQDGQGILKSTNGGASWTLAVQSPFSGQRVGSLVVDRTTSGSSQHVLAANAAGIFRSTDGGATWPQVSYGGATVVLQDPTNAAQFWAARSDLCNSEMGSIDMSSDGGATWHTVFTSYQQAARVALGVGTGGTAYAAFAACGANYGRLLDLEKTTNNGGSWTSISGSNTTGLFDYFYLGSGSQGWYDNVVAVDPSNSSNVVFGGVDAMVTKDGGKSYANITNSYGSGVVHSDNHAAIFTTGRRGSILWLGNDGGVWESTDLGSTWSSLNSSFDSVLFYSGTALSATKLLGGTQDNGSPGNLPGAPALPTWQSYFGGDGGYTAIDPTSDTIYAENQHLLIYQGHSSSPNTSFNQASPCSGSYKNGTDPACNDPAAWAAPFLMDPTNPMRLIAATNKIFETTSGGMPAGTQGYSNCGRMLCGWKVISPALTGTSTTDYITALAMGPPGQTGTIFTASSNAVVSMTTNDGSTWTNISGSGLFGTVVGIVFNPFNLAELWVATDSGVFHTLNAGTSTTWTQLPGLSVTPRSIALDRFNPATIYVGSDTGAVVCTTCGGTTTPPTNWAPFGTGLPNVQVLAMTISADGKNVVAWTHGRGVWTIPVLPSPCLTVTIAGGEDHSLAVGTDGFVYSWGHGTSGQLGKGAFADDPNPGQVSTISGLPTVSSVAAGGFHSAARGTDGTIWTWGSNVSGGLGSTNYPGYPGASDVPVQVQGPNGSGFLTGVSSIAAGEYNFTVATKALDGSVWAWGDNTDGALGNNSTGNSPTPVQVKGPGGTGFLTGIIQVSAGNHHVVALRVDGTVWAWGVNGFGELGIGKTTTMQTTPVQVVAVGGKGFLTGAVSVGTLGDTSVAVLSNGTIVAWGNNQYGQLGINKVTTYSATPVTVLNLSGLSANTSAISGGEHSVAADPSTGKAWGWGDNVYGQVGDNSLTQRLTPSAVASTAMFTEIAAGAWHSLGLGADGTVWAWGYNYYGQLGNGQSGVNQNPMPTPINGLSIRQRQAC